MIFICALLPISNLAVSLAYGGACSSVAVLLTFFCLPLFAMLRIQKWFLIPFCTLSVVLRFCAIFNECFGALGSFRGMLVVLACIVASAVAAYNGDSAMHTPTPVFFITALLAVYIAVISAGRSEFYTLSRPSAIEALSAAVCPLSSCAAFSCISQYPSLKRMKGALCGIVICAVFLLFGGAKAEFGFISVPLAMCASALEIKSLISIIIKSRE